MDSTKLLQELRNAYGNLGQRYTTSIVNLKRHSTPVNFKESLSVPIHRWYNYKEGFSPRFVRDFISRYSHGKDDVVFDPFGGVGTTVLEASMLGHHSFSTDVNPLGNFAAKVKSHSYSYEEINDIKKELSSFESVLDYETGPDLPNETVIGYFHPETYNSLLKIINYIRNISSECSKNLLLLALLSEVETLSTHRKDGNGLKKKRFLPQPCSFQEVKVLIINRIKLYLSDLLQTHVLVEPTVYYQSNIEEYTLPQKADIVITSPPYANCFDYSKVYMNELWVGGFFLSHDDQTTFREKSVTSHVHYRWKPRNESYANNIVEAILKPILATKQLWSSSIPAMLTGYFSDMGKFLDILSHNLNTDATVGIVVGNSVYAGVVVATDLLIAEMAEKLGYSVEGIHIYRQLSSSPQQMSLIEENDKPLLRESLIILKWNK